jgi:hypothetical protein
MKNILSLPISVPKALHTLTFLLTKQPETEENKPNKNINQNQPRHASSQEEKIASDYLVDRNGDRNSQKEGVTTLSPPPRQAQVTSL